MEKILLLLFPAITFGVIVGGIIVLEIAKYLNAFF